MTANRRRSPSAVATTTSSDDSSSDIDELDYRSRKLTKLLKKNADKAERRKSLLNVVRDKAYLLEDQVKLLERQTSSDSRSWRRRAVVVMGLVSLSAVGIVYGSKMISSKSEH